MEYINDYLKITGGINASSHLKSKANDLAYTIGALRTFADVKVVKTYSVGSNSSNTNSVWFTTLTTENTPKGFKQVTFRCAHMNYSDFKKLGIKIGKIFKRGEVCYMPGTGGTKYAHIHIEFGFGKIKGSGWYKLSNGNWTISTTQGSCHIWEALYMRKGVEIAMLGDYRDDYNWQYKKELQSQLTDLTKVNVTYKNGLKLRKSVQGDVIRKLSCGNTEIFNSIHFLLPIAKDGYQWAYGVKNGINHYFQLDLKCINLI